LFGNMREVEFDARVKKKRSIALLAFLVSSALFGAADIFLYYSTSWSQGTWVLSTILAAVLLYTWCHYDALLLKQLIPRSLRFCIVLFAIVGVPMYLVRSRGWRGAARVGFGIPVLLLSIGIYYGSWYASLWIAEATGYYQ